MHVFFTIAATSFLGAASALECSNDDCFRAVDHVSSRIRASDCQSLFEVTVTPATSTVMRTVVVQTTGTKTKTILSSDKIAPTAAPSKRWQQQRDAAGALLSRSEPHQISTSPPQKTPDYAAPCGSVKAVSSVCSCMGYEHATITVPAPETTTTVTLHETETVTSFKTVKTNQRFPVPLNNTSAVFRNSTAARFGNSTAKAGNLTFSGSASRSASAPSSVSLTSLSDSARAFASSAMPGRTEPSGTSGATAASDMRITTGSVMGSSGGPLPASPSSSQLPTDTGSRTTFSNTNIKAPSTKATATFAPLFANSTTARSNTTLAVAHTSASLTGSGRFVNSTKPAASPGASSTASFSNSSTSVSISHTTSTAAKFNSTSAPFLNATAPAPFLNATISPLASATLPPFANSTAPGTLANSTGMPSFNATKPLFVYANATTSAPFLNATTFRALNATSVRFSNTSVPTATPTSTSSSMTCGETASPFMLKVSQPSGLFDGWFAKVLANTIMFTPSANQSSKFSVEPSGYLCAVGYEGEDSNPAIAIVEDKEGLTGSAVYLVDQKRMEDLGKQGYGFLDCAVNGDLACQGGQDLSNWVGCGLGLDISSDAGENVVVDTWNCTSVALSAVYE
ncbi:hypothetical protein PG994_011617 [Apiospora phragmitis]|uniref:Uncharacterized protein n=1 Tax=Apiospora phragmitis TaxID=2905665 RepID=A0ABR1TTH9_9PEZI